MKNKNNDPIAYLISLCYDGDQPMATGLAIGEKYEFENKKYIFDEDMYNDLVKQKESGLISVRIVRSGNIVNISGIRKNK